MEPEGTSRDDLDVRLHWPGAEPERAAEVPGAEPSNGAPVGHGSSEQLPVPAQQTGPPFPVPGESEALEAALGVISTRLDVLTDRVGSVRDASEEMPAQSAIIAALEKLEHSLTVLGEATARANDRLGASLNKIDEALALLAKRQPGAATSDGADEVLDHLKEVSYQIEALRRRIPLRGRADISLSAGAIQTIADAVVERLSASGPALVKDARSRPGDGPRRK